MTKKSQKSEKKFTEDAYTQLYRELEIEGTKFKPYTFGQFLELTPILERIYKRLEDEKIFENGLLEKLNFSQLSKVYLATAPDMIKLIAMATDEADEEDIKEWSIEKGILAISSLYYLNLGFLKNILALFTQDQHLGVKEGKIKS